MIRVYVLRTKAFQFFRLFKLSSLIIQDLVKSQIKSKKQSLMDSQT